MAAEALALISLLSWRLEVRLRNNSKSADFSTKNRWGKQKKGERRGFNAPFF